MIAAIALATGLIAVPTGQTPGAQDPAAARIDRFLQEHLAAIPVPGFSVVVVRGDRVILQKGYGVEVAGGRKPMTERSPVAIGSQTKSITAVAIVQLVEAGKLELDAPVVKYLPWFRTADGRGAEITVRMLLNNTSGLAGLDRWLASRDTAESVMERDVRSLSSVPLIRAPGQSFEYANENWTVLGVLISTVTGQPYSHYLDRSVFAPLGMTHSTTRLSRFAEIGALWGHYAGPDGVRPAEPRFLAAGLAAGSELRSSAADMGRFLSMLLARGKAPGARLLSEASVAELFTPRSMTTVTIPEMESLKRAGYGMGWVITEVDGRTLAIHGGDAIVMTSMTAIDTTKRIAASLLYNGPSLDARRFPGKIWLVNNLLHLAAGEPISDFGRPVDQDPTLNSYELPVAQLDRYTGSYLSSEGYRLAITRDPKAPRLLLNLVTGSIHYDFWLDFASPSSAVLRSVAPPRLTSFQLSRSGEVIGLSGGVPGGVYRKPSAAELVRVRDVRSPDGAITFPLPRGWTVAWTGSGFVATDTADAAIRIEGTLRGEGWATVSAATRASIAEPDRRLLVERRETVGRFVWEELLWSDSAGQRMVAWTDDAGMRLAIRVTAPAGALTATIRDVVAPLMSGLHLRAPRLAVR